MPHCFFGWLAFLDHLYNRGPGTGYHQCTGKGKGQGVSEQHPFPPPPIGCNMKGGWEIAKHIKLSCGLLETWDPQ